MSIQTICVYRWNFTVFCFRGINIYQHYLHRIFFHYWRITGRVGHKKKSIGSYKKKKSKIRRTLYYKTSTLVTRLIITFWGFCKYFIDWLIQSSSLDKRMNWETPSNASGRWPPSVALTTSSIYSFQNWRSQNQLR